MAYTEGDKVQVQLGPSIEAATIVKVNKNRATITLADNQVMDVDTSHIITRPRPKIEFSERPAGPEQPTTDTVAAALAVPNLDREADEEEASAYVISDEWHGQLEQGDPFFEAAEPFVRANPDRHFRYLGNATVKRHGKRGYQPVTDPKTGKVVDVSGMTLAQVPKHVHEERARRVAALADDQDAKRQSAIRDQLEQAGKEAGVGAQMLDAFETARTLRDGLEGKQFRPKG